MEHCIECDCEYADLVMHREYCHQVKDKYVGRVISKFQSRSAAGLKKYGVTLERDDLTREQWLTHLQEELMDAVNYIERLKDAD